MASLTYGVKMIFSALFSCPWSVAEVEAGREEDRRRKEDYFKPAPVKQLADDKPKKGRWQKFKKRFL